MELMVLKRLRGWKSFHLNTFDDFGDDVPIRVDTHSWDAPSRLGKSIHNRSLNGWEKFGCELSNYNGVAPLQLVGDDCFGFYMLMFCHFQRCNLDKFEFNIEGSSNVTTRSKPYKYIENYVPQISWSCLYPVNHWNGHERCFFQHDFTNQNYIKNSMKQ